MNRAELIKFCTESRAYLEGIKNAEDIELMREDFAGMTDEELEREADWLDDMLGK